jgi:hypothetical protein
MRVNKAILKLSMPALAVALLFTACSKSEELPPPPPSPSPEKSESSKPSPSTATVPSPKPAATVAPSVTSVPSTTAAAPTGTPSQVADALETVYIANPDFTARVDTIYKLTDEGTPEAIASLGRLFHAEKDPDLKTEILDSLFDVDGQDERKAALLSAGAGADQAKEVRLSAIDGLEDVDAKYALPILQALASDPDEEIRDAAKDAIEMLQPVQPTQPAQAK